MDKISKYIQYIKSSINKHPYLWSVTVSVLYMSICQYSFISNGDAWAESFAEYLDESIRKGWDEVFRQNWAGYFTLLPSLISKTFVTLNGPIGFADYYYRIIVVLFTIFTCSIISLKYFRNFIEQDILRILLSLSSIVIISDLTSFSLINIWYLGYVPIIIYCLTPKKSSTKLDVFMGIFGLLISLSKPFIFIIPFYIYRLLKTKQYFGAGLALAGALMQSYQIIFNDQRGLVDNANIDIKQTIFGVIIGAGTSTIKLMGINSATYITLLVALFILLAIALLLWKAKGFLVCTLIIGLFLFAVYTYVLSPDGWAYFGPKEINQTLNFNLKRQREILINASLLIAVFAIASYYYKKKYVLLGYRINFKFISLSILIIFICIIHKPIDATSAGVSNKPLSMFRNQLNAGTPTCVPLAPNVFFFINATWSFGYKGTCHTLTNDTNLFKPNTLKISYNLGDGLVTYDAKYFRLDQYNLQAIVVPINYKGKYECSAYLKNINDDKVYETQILKNKNEPQLITFNTSGMNTSEKYTLQISTNCNEEVLVGKFSPNQEIMTYPYFLQNDVK